MRRYFAATTAALTLAFTPALAASQAGPVRLSEQQLDEVTGGDRIIVNINFILENVYNSPINAALVLQINGSGTAHQHGSATAAQSVAAAAGAASGDTSQLGAGALHRAHPQIPAHAAGPAHARR
jgi:hypothetical protein